MIEFALQNAWLLPLLPAVAFAIIGLFTLSLPRLSSCIALLFMFASFVLAVLTGIGVLTRPEYIDQPLEYAGTWFSMPGLTIEMGVRIDPTSAMMLFVVTLVAFLVQIYSLGYMKGDPGFARFYAFLSLFTATMLGLVISNNLLQMFIFWELVGLCSYLLIGYYYHKDSAREAAKKAFMTTRVGDFGLLLGILFLQIIFGTLNLGELAEKVPAYADFGVTAGALTLIAMLLFLGPIGKSGQFPLHVWLPDAMEGPTPVSALIHAATMVVAGVYLVARMLFLFIELPEAAALIAWVGGFTALFAATIAVAQVELKKILAYSTVSQLGFMMLALGAGSSGASLFHLMTHAFFKALLFLAAGSVLHALHGKVSIWDMGGLRKKMPITAGAFLVGGLAIAGIPPFSGFFSKDEILVVVKDYSLGLYIMAAITAFLTAFYMWRMIFVTFFNEEKPGNHPHESPVSMLIPLYVLGFLAIVGGLAGTPWTPKDWNFFYWIRMGEYHELHAHYDVIASSVLLAAAGIGLAYFIYVRGAAANQAGRLADRFRPLHTLLYNKYYVDEFYMWVNRTLVGGAAAVIYWFDIHIVDAIVNGFGKVTQRLGTLFRYSQTGRLQSYAMILFLAIILIVLVLVITDPASATYGLGGGK
jgi:NADH-quinone oxidoreductase subunit L